MSPIVPISPIIGASFFTAFSQETSQFEADNLRGTVFSPVGPLYEEQEAFLDPRDRGIDEMNGGNDGLERTEPSSIPRV